MTRLDLGKMNKEYVDTEQMEGHLLNTSFMSQTLSAKGSARPASFSLDTVHGMLKQHKDVNKVKSLLRHNELAVDHDSRTHLWTLLCCSTLEKIVDETFQMYAGKFANVAPEKMLPIEDMDEDMRVHHMLSEEGVRACHRVLYAIAETHPHIQQFSPLLYAFVSVMLHYADEQACFRCIGELMRRRDINYFLAPSELDLVAACFVLKDLAYKYAKPAAVHIARHCPDEDLTSFLNDWVLWIFKHLPFHYLVRIIDCYLVEGYKVLFRVALILIRLFHKISAQKSEFMDAKRPDAGVKSMCTEIHKYISIEKLLKDAFAIRGFSKKEIDSLFSKIERDLRAGDRALNIRPTQTAQESDMRLSKPISRPRSSHSLSNEKSQQRLMAMKSKKSFKLDKDVHTQIVLDDIDSLILAKHQLLTVWSWLPPAEGVKEPLLAFTTNEHGYSLKTLYEKIEHYGPSLIVIRTVDGDMFGAYCGSDWLDRHSQIDAGAKISYFGCGQTFVFKVYPDVCYPWVGKEHPVTLASASMFQAGDRNILMVGGGNGVALQIDKDLDYGRTEHCDTFENEPLCESVEFRIQMLEAYVFT